MAEPPLRQLLSLADDPIAKADDDELERAAFAEQIVNVLELVRAQPSSTVLALIGPWGSGKSSVLELVAERLAPLEDEWTVAHFNPWELSSLDGLMFNFFEVLSSAMPDDFKDRTFLDSFRAYASKLLSMGGAITAPLSFLTGVDPGKLAEGISKLLEPSRSVQKLRERLEETLSKLPRHILVVMDDVDRLAPSELLMLFKLVRQLGRLPKVCYLLAYDEQTLLSVLQESELARNNPSRALAYLEKIVQLRLDLPILHEHHARRMVDRSLESLPPQPPAVQARLLDLFDKWLLLRLSEPRSIKRFFAQVSAYLPLVTGAVDLADFLALTYLRTFYPLLYRELYHRKCELTVSSDAQRARRAAFEPLLLDTGISDARERQSLERLLDSLFPEQPGNEEEFIKGNRVSSNESFDRYFYFGVPPGDVSDAMLARMLEALKEPPPPGKQDELALALRARLELVLPKLMDLEQELDVEQRVRLLVILSRLYRERFGQQEPTPLKDRLLELGAFVEMGLDEAAARRVLDSLPDPLDRDYLVLTSARIASRVHLETLWSELSKAFPARLEPLLQQPMGEVRWCLELISAWARIHWPQKVQEWFEAQLDSTRTKWTSQDLALHGASILFVVEARSGRRRIQFDMDRGLPLSPELRNRLDELLENVGSQLPSDPV
ncbi:hypothetical protein BO221_11440 [Archangium sp. Cb G35]|uniref:KAP family P-loop NTPase fold protein n=1 Tax=Archangium sp. Cb G35 TaxID=1920190 RepID=UPI0009370310|nr:P-loop NTPase fold protein [Archangium sp. Cb G35]OJT24993.1 hypothetical protein BO221_11440 [Archangium sp. Cb G35]